MWELISKGVSFLITSILKVLKAIWNRFCNNMCPEIALAAIFATFMVGAGLSIIGQILLGFWGVICQVIGGTNLLELFIKNHNLVIGAVIMFLMIELTLPKRFFNKIFTNQADGYEDELEEEKYSVQPISMRASKSGSYKRAATRW
jgi:heme/copper-type cytochrome/quinol oxidase subunit 1